MKGLVASSLFTVGAANILWNAEYNRSVDIKIMCVDGTDTPGCDRQEPESLTKGANLQLWDCQNDANQNFEIVGGRLRNTLTGLCLDIKSMCLDGSDTAGCERQSVSNLTVDANVQLWTCRSDDAAGRNSSSYGNQKWDFLSDGTIKNVATGLCLTAGGGKTETSGRNLHVHTCVAAPGSPAQIFDFEPGCVAGASAATTGSVTTQAPGVAPSATTQAPTTGGSASMPANLAAATAVGNADAQAALSTGLLNSYSEMQLVHPGWIVGAMGVVSAVVALFVAKRNAAPAVEFENLTTSE